MNREMRRLMEREERRQKKQEKGSGASRRAAATASSRAPQTERRSLWERVRGYLHDVRQELRRVSWPTQEQMVAFTTVTVITTVVLTGVVFGFDVVMKEIVLFVVERS